MILTSGPPISSGDYGDLFNWHGMEISSVAEMQKHGLPPWLEVVPVGVQSTEPSGSGIGGDGVPHPMIRFGVKPFGAKPLIVVFSQP